jgi:choline dehydrogenase
MSGTISGSPPPADFPDTPKAEPAKPNPAPAAPPPPAAPAPGATWTAPVGQIPDDSKTSFTSTAPARNPNVLGAAPLAPIRPAQAVGDAQALPTVGEYDYIIVGSGAGGSPLAARLALAGYRVCVLEAGPGSEDPINAIPSFHALASELGLDPNKPTQGDAGKFLVTQNPLDPKDPNYVKPGTPGMDGRSGIDMPRGWGFGGSPEVNAMITKLPPPQEWQKIYEETGDPDWKPENMRKIWETAVERNDAHPILKALDSLGRHLHLKGLENIHGHGFQGWLDVSEPGLAQASVALKDPQLSRIFFETLKNTAGMGGVSNYLKRVTGGFDDNNSNLTSVPGFSITPEAMKDGVRSDPGEHLKEVMDECERRRQATHGVFQGRVDVKTGALATKVQLDDGDPPRAKGVEILAGDHLYEADNQYNPLAKGTKAQVLAKNEVILSAGTFNSPQLLMLSGIGPEQELRNAQITPRVIRPGVGTNLQDRFEVGVVSQMKQPFSVLKDAKFTVDPRVDPEFKNWVQGNGGTYATDGVAVAVAFKSDPKKDKPDVYIFGVPGDFHGYYPGYSQDTLLHKDRWTWVVLDANQNNAKGTLTLDKNDPTKQPIVNKHSFEGTDAAANVEATAKAVEWVRKLNEKIGAQAELVPGPDVKTHEQLVEWVKQNAWGHHPTGTDPMGTPDDPMAVVDSNFKVIGTQGLRVVDQSSVKDIQGLFPVADLYVRSEMAAQKIIKEAAANGQTPTVGKGDEPQPLWTQDRAPSAAQRIALTRGMYDAFFGNKDGIPNDKGPGHLWWLENIASKVPLLKDLPQVNQWDSPRMHAFQEAMASAATLSPEGESIIPPSYRTFYKMMKVNQAQLANFPLAKISEGVVKADGVSVTDPLSGAKKEVSPQLFYQRWDPPDGVARKDVVVISPAYQATGRQWTEVAADLARKGNTVLVMDNEYAGLSKGTPGKFSGESVSAGIALMLSKAEQVRQDEKLPGKVRVLGESLGAGAAYSGVLNAYAGNIDLQGRPLPKDNVYVGMVNPYLGKVSDPLLQDLAGAEKKLRLPVPALPTEANFTGVYRDADAKKRFDQLAQLEDVKVHPEGIVDATKSLQDTLQAVEQGKLKIPPNVSLGILRTDEDASVDRHQTDRLEDYSEQALSYEKRIPKLRDHALVLNEAMRADIEGLATEDAAVEKAVVPGAPPANAPDDPKVRYWGGSKTEQDRRLNLMTGELKKLQSDLGQVNGDGPDRTFHKEGQAFEAEFTPVANPDLPPGVSPVGIFDPKVLAQVSRITGRLSYGRGDDNLNSLMPDVRGMAVRFETKDGKMQDLTATNAEVPFFHNPAELTAFGIATKDLAKAMKDPNHPVISTGKELLEFAPELAKQLQRLEPWSYPAGPVGLAKAGVRALEMLKAATPATFPRASFGTTAFWSGAPIRFGDKLVKFVFRPVERGHGLPSPDLFKEASEHPELQYELCVQFYTDPKNTPIDPPSHWNSPLIKMGVLNLKTADLGSDAQKALQSQFQKEGFNPGNALKGNEPYGLNEERATLYARDFIARGGTPARCPLGYG